MTDRNWTWKTIQFKKDIEFCLYCGKRIRGNTVGYESEIGFMHRNCWWKR